MKLITPNTNTEYPNSYWDGTGLFQNQYNELYKKHVPSSGSALTVNGELIRAISRLQHDYCNNGNGNACERNYENIEYRCYCGNNDDCEQCGGSGYYDEEEESESYITEMFENFLNLIENIVPNSKNIINQIRSIIKYSGNDFGAENTNAYNKLNDLVILYVLNNEKNDQKLPDSYEN